MIERQQATRKGPAVTVRFRSKSELANIRRAAKFEGLSLNTFVVGRASLAASKILETQKVSEQLMVERNLPSLNQ